MNISAPWNLLPLAQREHPKREVERFLVLLFMLSAFEGSQPVRCFHLSFFSGKKNKVFSTKSWNRQGWFASSWSQIALRKMCDLVESHGSIHIQSSPCRASDTPGKTNIAGWKLDLDWRCISYWRWGAMLVCQRVFELYSDSLGGIRCIFITNLSYWVSDLALDLYFPTKWGGHADIKMLFTSIYSMYHWP